jgi:hypothetical protein
MTLGIKSAKKGVSIVYGCRLPTSKGWITAMSSQFTTEKTIVLGYGGYEKIEKSFIN